MGRSGKTKKKGQVLKVSEGWKGAGGEVRNRAGGGAGQRSRGVAKVA